LPTKIDVIYDVTIELEKKIDVIGDVTIELAKKIDVIDDVTIELEKKIDVIGDVTIELAKKIDVIDDVKQTKQNCHDIRVVKLLKMNFERYVFSDKCVMINFTLVHIAY
jgi:hypothetical protein